ncbi:MAG: adenylate kinase [Spirochaetales bacterium]
MNLIFVGPPGAGKGTIAGQSAQKFSIPHISTGDIFRENIRNQTELGRKVKAILDKGELVPDELTIDLVRDRLAQPDAANGWILDGFPRTVEQATALDEFATVDRVIYFNVDDEQVIRRLSGRRVHPASGRTYHVEFNPPQRQDIDDVTGEPLILRDDDREEAIRHRLEVYREQTAPVIDYYKNDGRVVEIDAGQSIEAVTAELEGKLSG